MLTFCRLHLLMYLRIHRHLRMSNQHLGRLLKPDEGNVVATVGILVLRVNVDARGLDNLRATHK